MVISKGRRGEDPEIAHGNSHYNHLLRRLAGGSSKTILPDFYKLDKEEQEEVAKLAKQ